MAPRFVAQQLSHPRGIAGWLVRRGMNIGNASINAFALEQLDVRPHDSVLEVGFGGGQNISKLVQQAAIVVGVDRSRDSVAAADRRYGRQRLRAQTEFIFGEVEALPLPSSSFTKALTVHTVYFWTSLEQGFLELHRCLQPGGVLAVGFLPKAQMDLMHMPSDLFAAREPEEVASAAKGVGFSVEARQPNGAAQWMVLLCRKAS